MPFTKVKAIAHQKIIKKPEIQDTDWEKVFERIISIIYITFKI